MVLLIPTKKEVIKMYVGRTITMRLEDLLYILNMVKLEKVKNVNVYIREAIKEKIKKDKSEEEI